MKKCILLAILGGTFALLPNNGFAQHGCESHCCVEKDGIKNPYSDINKLVDDLTSDIRRNPDYHIIQGWDKLDAPMPPHQQYNATCFFFAVSGIIESLGYSQFDWNSHYSPTFPYKENNHVSGGRIDVGYRGTPENLMIDYAARDSFLSPNQGVVDEINVSTDYHFPDYPNPAGAKDQNCGGWFRNDQTYGFCIDNNGTVQDQRPIWMGDSALRGSCNGKCPCNDTATCGAIWYLNNNGWFGCNDADRYVDNVLVEDPGRIKARKIIKGFVDANVPLLASVTKGGHWIAIIGYADLDKNGLPRKAIIADSVSRRFWVTNDLDKPTNWNQKGYCSIAQLFPWNEHLDGGCERGGWAYNLAFIGLDLCKTSGYSCKNRYYGIEVICKNNGVEKHVIDMYPEDPFASINDSYACDDIVLRYSDKDLVVSNARIKRYSGPGKWKLLTNHAADNISAGITASGRKRHNVITWDSSWGTNYWLVTNHAGGSKPQRRTEIELTFTDGTRKTIEISPPHTYQAKIECIDNGSVKKTWYYETDHQYYEKRDSDLYQTFFPEVSDIQCDDVAVTVNYGEGRKVTEAKVARYGYGNHSGKNKWYILSGPKKYDNKEVINDNLSGETTKFTWNTGWGSNFWIVASDYQLDSNDKSEDRRTIFTFNLEDGTERNVEITPISNQ